jgi:hypothetical protein
MLQDDELHTLTIVDPVLGNTLINDSAKRDWIKDTVGTSNLFFFSSTTRNSEQQMSFVGLTQA